MIDVDGGGLVSRQGGKWLLRKKVLARFPKSSYDTYVEPFIGGGSIFLEAPLVKTMVGGDTDKRLINLWKDLKKIDVKQVIQFKFGFENNTENNTENDENKKKWNTYNRMTKKPTKDHTMRFIANIWIRQHSFSGLAKSWLGTDALRHTSELPVLKKKLLKYQERVATTKFYNKSYEYLIDKYDSPSAFFYCDPPYYETDTSSYETGNIDHKLFYNYITNIKGKFLISYNDTKYIKELYKNYHITIVKYNQSLGDKGGIIKASDLLISNY